MAKAHVFRSDASRQADSAFSVPLAAIPKTKRRGIANGPMKQGREYVYAISSGSGGMVKFGMTSHPVRRIRSLETAVKSSLWFIGYIEVASGSAWAIEADVLARARRTGCPTSGEWFFLPEQAARSLVLDAVECIPPADRVLIGFGSDAEAEDKWSDLDRTMDEMRGASYRRVRGFI